MRPHMNHIAETLVRKKIAMDAIGHVSSYEKYMKIVNHARLMGHTDNKIVSELIRERERIQKDVREGDPIFQQGVHNSKVSCINAINLIISELQKDDDNA